MIKKIVQRLKKENSQWKAKFLLPYLSQKEKVLDFGCGDLTLARTLKKGKPSLQMAGIDVVDFSIRPKNISVHVYNGNKLPFKSNTFDTVISFYVFHHCNSAFASLEECLRVGKRVIVVESIPRFALEIPIMKFLDFLFNVWKERNISLPYEFHSKKEWIKKCKEKKATIKIKNISTPLMRLLPIGGQYVLEIRK